jgi:hypothetical protein
MHDLRASSAALPEFRLPETLSHPAEAGPGQSGEAGVIIARRIQCGPGAIEEPEFRGAEGMPGEARRVLRRNDASAIERSLGGMLRELLSKSDDVFVRRWPVCVARIAVEHQRVRFQLGFEFFLAECNRLIVVVRTYNFKIYAVVHESSR